MDDERVLRDGDGAAGAAAEGLWSFANRVYADPAVATACLRAQDEHDLDVNLLLFAAWLAGRRCVLDRAGAERAEAHCAPWRREVVEPLRRARRQWRDTEPHAGAYAALKALELQAERHQLEALEALGANEAIAGVSGDAAPSVPASPENRLRANLGAVACAAGADSDAAAALAAALHRAHSGARNPPD